MTATGFWVAVRPVELTAAAERHAGQLARLAVDDTAAVLLSRHC